MTRMNKITIKAIRRRTMYRSSGLEEELCESNVGDAVALDTVHVARDLTVLVGLVVAQYPVNRKILFNLLVFQKEKQNNCK